MAVIQCRHFSGYKPCGKNTVCSENCEHKDLISSQILIVHLGALGAVVRATCILDSVKKKYPHSFITWITDAPAHHLLKHNPLIDRVVTSSHEDLLSLKAVQFEATFVIDKSLKASGIEAHVQSKKTFGFKIQEGTQAIVPATPAAEELWQLGLDNNKKFFVNKKPETQLLIEALELGTYEKQEYNMPLSADEILLSSTRRKKWQVVNSPVIGINTGCSNVITYKRLTVSRQRQLIQDLKNAGYNNIVLLGGPEDTERNSQIAHGLDVTQSPTEKGLRDGYASVNACDIVITGDSLGMHMAIAAKKYVIAWFGPTCGHEIELYGRGQTVLTKATCSPCWKRVCEKSVMCYDQVDLKEIVSAVEKESSKWIQRKFYLSKLPSSEICS